MAERQVPQPRGKAGDGNVCGDANLAFLKGSTNANCGTPGLTGDDFCGLVNATTTNLPWSFTDKSGTASNGALNGEFYEAGINLTPLGLGGECFSTLVSETRSSTSTTATLKDFIMSPFAPCQAELATDVDSSNSSSATNVHPSEAVRDHATITGNQAGKIPGVSDGDSKVVTFFLCKNTDPTSATYNSCPAGSGTNIGTGNLSTVANSNVASEAYSPYVNCAADGSGCFAGKNPLTTGHYCFRAEWTGDSNYTGKLVEDGSISNECFDVVVIPTDIKTKQSWYPNDTATITSTQTGDNLVSGGTVKFTLYDTGTCTGNVLYQETVSSVPSAAQHSVEVRTTNPGNNEVLNSNGKYEETTGYADTANTTTAARSWKVEYTPPSGDNAHTGKSSSCTTGHTEKHTYTYTNDPGAP